MASENLWYRYQKEGAKIDVHRPVLLNEWCGLFPVREMVQF